MKLEAKGFFLLALMVLASTLALILTPNRADIKKIEKSTLERIIPKNFGTWTVFDGAAITLPDPQEQEAVSEIYSSVVNRSYRDSNTGHVVMLVIAYGAEQSKQSQVHLPEVCYPAQGFQIQDKRKGELPSSEGSINVTRMVAISGERHEPITYWIRIGNQIVRGALDQKLAIIEQGLKGFVADGALIRISSIGKNSEKEYAIQAEFAVELFKVLDHNSKKMLLGDFAERKKSDR